MRILLVTQFYVPEPVQVIQELATGLRDAGHEVEVLTGFPHYPRAKLYDGYRMRAWQRETLSGIPVLRVPLYAKHSRSPVARMLSYFSFAFFTALLGPFLASRCDVVLVYGSPATAMLGGWWIAKWRRVPCVMTVPDLWPEAFASVGVRKRAVLAPIGVLARWIYRRASRLIAVSRGFADRLRERGIPDARIRHIPIWVDVDAYRPIPPDDEVRKRLGLTRPIVLMYAGQIGLPQRLDAVVEAANLLRDDDRIEIAIVGDGLERPALERRVAELGLTNVRFPGSFPASEMSRVYSVASALIVHLADDPVLRMWIPHKIFAYMAAGKPVLCAVAGETAEIVRNASAGVTCAPGDPQSIADAIRRLAAMTPDEREQLGRNGRLAAERDYELRVVLRRVAAVLEEVAAAPAPPSR